MNQTDDDRIRALLDDTPRAPDPQFVMLTHKVIAVETMVCEHRKLAWRACRRDLISAAALIAGIPISAWVFSGTEVSATAACLLLGWGLSIWMLVHDWQLPTIHGLAKSSQNG
jgi:hypothetical protein